MPEERPESAPTAARAASIANHVVKRDGRFDMNATLEAWRSAQDNLPPEEQAKRDAAMQRAARGTRGRETFNRILAGFGVTAFFLVGLIQFFGTGVRFITTTPENAVVLADDAARTNACPPCAASGRMTVRGRNPAGSAKYTLRRRRGVRPRGLRNADSIAASVLAHPTAPSSATSESMEQKR